MDTYTQGEYVLIAEDDTDDQEMLMEALKEVDPGFQFRVASSGSKAIKMFQALASDDLPCMIILDYNLPELSGAEVLAKLNELPHLKNITKVVWSTSGSPVYEKRCYELGADYYAVKPIGLAEMKAIARKMVDLCLTKGANE